MIPFPLAADDHQRKNAEALEREGAAKMILQRDLTGLGLAKAIKDLVHLPDEVRKMGEASRNLARGDAAAAAVDLIWELVESRRRSRRVKRALVRSLSRGTPGWRWGPEALPWLVDRDA